MSFNITTGYPVRTGDAQKDFENLYSTFCSLIDEIGYVVPQISSQISSLSANIASTASAESEE